MPCPSPRSSRTTPPAAPTISASRVSSSVANSGSGSSAYWSGAVCISSLIAPALGPGCSVAGPPPERAVAWPHPPAGGGPPATGCPAASRRSSRNHTPLPVGRYVVPHRLAKWSTSSSPRPRSETSLISELSLRTPTVSSSTEPTAKSETVTVSPMSSATTSMSSSVRACSTAFVVSSVVSSRASLSRSSRLAAASTDRTRARAAAGVRRSAGSRTRRMRSSGPPEVVGPASADTSISSTAARP